MKFTKEEKRSDRDKKKEQSNKRLIKIAIGVIIAIIILAPIIMGGMK